MSRSFLLAMCLCSFCTRTVAQNCNIQIRVQVVETHNFQPVYPLVVHIHELDTTLEADEKGRAFLSNVCPGDYTFHLFAFGYKSYSEKISVKDSVTLRFKLDHLETELQQVEIVDERIRRLLQSRESLGKREIASQSGNTLGNILQSISGVTTLSTGATIAKPVIHGLHSNRIVLLNNGIRQEDQQWGNEHAPNIDPFLAEDISVIKGAASVRYGTDAIGGVVLVEPKPLRHEAGTEGELNLAGFSNNRMGVASAMVGHRLRKIPLSFRLQGTFKKGGNYRIPGYWVANTGLEEKNYSATVGYRRVHFGAEIFYSHFTTDLGVYRGAHTGNQADLEAAIKSPVPLVPADFTYSINRPKQHVEHDLIKTKLNGDNRLGVWNITHAFQSNLRQEFDVLRTENNKAQLNLRLNTQTLNIHLDHRPVANISGQVGVDGIYQENYFRPGDRLFIPNYRSLGGAAYVIERYRKNGWTIEGGVRFDKRWYEMFNPEGANQQVVRYEFDFQNLSGTLGINRQLKPRWSLSLTLANAWRAPQANELFSSGLHHGAARIELGNKSLKAENSYNLNLETKYLWKDKLNLNASLYTQFISDFIYLEPGADLLTIRGYFKTFNYRQTDAQLTGADVSAGYQWNKFLSSDLKASFLRAWDRGKQDWLILMPADRISFGSKYTHSISEKIQDAFVGCHLRYVFQQERIPADFDRLDHPRPPASYLLTDAEAGAVLKFRRQPVHASISITNLFNTKYRDYLDAFRYFIDQPGRNVILRLRVPIIF